MSADSSWTIRLVMSLAVMFAIVEEKQQHRPEILFLSEMI